MTSNATPGQANAEDLGPCTVAWSTAYRLRSSTINQDFLIEVAWPPVAPQEGMKLPVVYVLDGNHAFGVAAAAARFIQSGPFPMPATLVVGVGYHFATPEDQAHWSSLRLRDLSPCRDGLYESQAGGSADECGGAAAFLAFIEGELKPFIAGRYPVDPLDQTIVGASLGGLFALYALLTRPGSFRRCVAISPAIYWGDAMLLDIEAERAALGDDLPADVFLAAGGLEEAHDARQAFVSNVYRLDARLRQRAYPGLNLSMRIFEGETHMSVYPGAVTRGLAEVFGGYRDMRDWSRWLPAS
jgi:uncharacterized protein